MKIMISSDGPHAHYYERMAWAKALNACGNQVSIWEINRTPAFDAFDRFEPDIFLGQSYNIDRAVYQCIKERPHLKVGLRAGDWGDFSKKVDAQKYNILFAEPLEIDLLRKLKDETGKPDFVHIHYDEDAVKVTHNKWEDAGIKVVSIMMSADLFDYTGGVHKEEYASDIAFVGGYWPYKAQIIDRYLLPLCYPMGEYKVKIYGNQRWRVPQYMGYADNNEVKHILASAKICPNLSEPHAHEFGFDVNERCFKLLSNNCFCISDNVESLKKIFENKGIVFANNPQEFQDLVEYYIKNPEERESHTEIGYDTVMTQHTNFHRAAQIFSALGLKRKSQECLTRLDEIKKTANQNAGNRLLFHNSGLLHVH